MEPYENLEVDSAVDLQLPVDVDMSVGVDTVGEQHALGFVAGYGVGPLCGAEVGTQVWPAQGAGRCPRVTRLVPASATSMSLGTAGSLSALRSK